MTPAHRKMDEENEDHRELREWNGPTRADWDEMSNMLKSTASDVCEIKVALWGDRKAGMENDGGMLAEVQKQKSVRLVAWSSICIALSTTFTLIIGWAWGKITRGGP